MGRGEGRGEGRPRGGTADPHQSPEANRPEHTSREAEACAAVFCDRLALCDREVFQPRVNAPKDQGVSACKSLFLARLVLALVQCKQLFAALSLCPKGGRKVQAPVSAQPGFYAVTKKKESSDQIFFCTSLCFCPAHMGGGL